MKTPGTDRWRYRREPRPFHPDDVGYHALAAGIVLQAVEDWKEAKRKLKAAEKIEEKNARASAMGHHRNRMDEIEKFFYGSWYGVLCDIDPDFIMRKLRYGR